MNFEMGGFSNARPRRKSRKISAGNVNENVTFPKLLSGLSFGQEECVTIKVTITGFKVSSVFISRTT